MRKAIAQTVKPSIHQLNYFADLMSRAHPYLIAHSLATARLDEYKTWLEQEKKNLQAIVDYNQTLTGEKSWTPSPDRFEWNQGLMDEIIRQYERTLQDIKNGALVTKLIDGCAVDASMLDDDDDVMMTFAIENSGFKRTW